MSKLADRFVLEREVGSGGMARVFLGRDEVLDRPVAVKVLKPMLGDTDAGIRFRREGRTAARLSHPNIVQVYDAGEAELDGREASYIVMEYLSGGDLKGMIDGRGKLSGPELAKIGEEVCRGLAHAHGRGVVHRDIKPHNILLDDKGRAKVSDFGIARALDTTRATRTGAYLGTALYSSPEQLQGHKVTPKSDVYSLGATMYQAATGGPPFTGTPIEIASQHVSRPPEPPSRRDPNLDLDGDLEALILACLAKNAEDRPNTEQAGFRFGEAIRSPETDHEVGPAAPPLRPARPRPAPRKASSGGRAQRRRFPGVLAAVALLAVLGVIGLLAAPSLFSQSGNVAPNNDSQNTQAGAGESNEVQGPRNEQANAGGGTSAGDGGNGGQNPQTAGEPTTETSTPAASQTADDGNPGDDRQGGSDRGGQQAQGSSPEEAAAQTVRNFYETAAGPNYQNSWNFLSSGYQQEIGSRESMTRQFQTLERIEFTEGPTTTQINGNTATVSASTIAHHSYGDETRTGTASLVRTGNRWKISSLNFAGA